MATKKIIIGTDFSENSTLAICGGNEWAKKLNTSPLAIHVAEPFYNLSYLESLSSDVSMYDKVKQILQYSMKEQLDKINKGSSDEIEGKIISGEVTSGFLDAISEQKAELLVLGSKGHSTFEHMTIGSSTERMVRLSPIPVLAIKDKRAKNPKKILLALELNQTNDYSLKFAKKIAKLFDAKLILTHIVSPFYAQEGNLENVNPRDVQCIEDILEIAKKDASEQIDLISQDLTKEGIQFSIELETTHNVDVTKNILQRVDSENPDILMLGTHGRSGVKKWFLGSVAENLIRKADCSLLVVNNLCKEGVTNE